MRFDLREGFPVLTTKKIHFKSVVTELLWFLRGETDLAFLQRNGCRIWNEWAYEGKLGPVYGKQWRNWETKNGRGIDQLVQAVETIQRNPHSRRIVVSAWNPADLPDESIPPRENVKTGKMALAPCHALFQFYVSKGFLSCQLYARSQDVFLGTPFNVASYALLTHLVALETGLQPAELIWTGGDVHLYENHLEQARLQLSRSPFPLPELLIKERKPLDRYEVSDFALIGYRHHPPIKGSVSV